MRPLCAQIPPAGSQGGEEQKTSHGRHGKVSSLDLSRVLTRPDEKGFWAGW